MPVGNVMLDSRLTYVVAVARTGSFTGAAESVGVTQSAVTKSVADLERQLGTSLFYRTSRGALLTETGRDFVERASRILDDAHELLDGSTSRSEGFSGLLRIGVCPASLEWRLIDPLVDLLARHPNMRFEVIGSTFEKMVQQLRGGTVDVAVGFEAAFNEWPDIRRSSVAALRSRFFVRKDHPILKQNGYAVSDLAKYTFVSPSDSRPFGAVIKGLYESQGIDWRTKLHIIDYFPIVRRIVASSDAIGVAVVSYVRSPAFSREFVALEDLDTFAPAPLCCAVRARWEPKPAVRAFITTMKTELGTATDSALRRRAGGVRA
jgi:DNA-binding transcriptional LysR family regulator